jgi:hypothetical protein
MEVHDLRENRNVSLKTIEDFAELKASTESDLYGKVWFIGAITNPPSKPITGSTEVCDADGEVVSIKDLNLVLSGSIREEVPPMKAESMRDFAEAVARSATWNQRHLPFFQKVTLLWRFFLELFFNRTIVTDSEGDPYKRVVEAWYRKQITPAPVKKRWSIFLSRIRDMFVHTKQSEDIDTFGMPGFQSFKTSR